MEYIGTVFTGNGYRMKPIATITAATLPALKAKASRICNGYFNVSDRLEITERDENTNTEYNCVFHRYNQKAPNNTIIRSKWG